MLICAFGGALVLIFVWRWNYNLFGDFYDYSIFASSGNYLHHGLKPYRDFTTSLQSLPIYLCYGAECVFGPRYLSLAYANLLVGLTFYAATILLLKKRLPFLLCVLCAMAMCVATFFQHGILWYNSIAMMFLALIVWQSANIAQENHVSAARVTILCLLLFLSSMTKANFHLLGVFMAFVGLAWSFAHADSTERKRFSLVLPLILLCAFVLGPLCETAANGTTFGDYVQQVFRTPKGRIRDILPQLVSPGLYFNKLHDFYPDNYSAGIYVTGAAIFALCAFIALRGEKTRLLYSIQIFLAGQFVASLLVTASNHDIQILTASYLIVGLVAIYLMFNHSMSAAQDRGFKTAIALLSAIFLITGSASTFKHSRLRFLESEKDNSHGTAIVDPQLTGYLQGVRFTKTAADRFVRITSFMQKHNLTGAIEKVYWGPGLELMNRVYDTCPMGHLPLWYHLNTSVNDSDSPRIIEALEKNHYEWVLGTMYYMKEFPPGVRKYLHDHFDLAEQDAMDDGLIILHRKNNF